MPQFFKLTNVATTIKRDIPTLFKANNFSASDTLVKKEIARLSHFSAAALALFVDSLH